MIDNEIRGEFGKYAYVVGPISMGGSSMTYLNRACKSICMKSDKDLIIDSWLGKKVGASWYCCTREWRDQERKRLGYVEEAKS